MKTMMVTKRKQRELFEYMDSIEENADKADNELESVKLAERADGMFEAIMMLGLEGEYWDWYHKKTNTQAPVWRWK